LRNQFLFGRGQIADLPPTPLKIMVVDGEGKNCFLKKEFYFLEQFR